MCGVVGLKPTSGLVPNRGGIPLSPSLDAQGPMTKTVADTALILNVIAGYDPLDITSEDHPAQDFVAQMTQPVAGLRIGLPAGRFDQMQPEVAQAVWAAIDLLRTLVAEVKDVSLPPVGPAMSLIPFGETYLVHRESLKARRFLYSSKHRALFDGLADLKAVDFIEANNEMRLLRRTINSAFADFDLIVQPSLHVVARPLEHDPLPNPDMARAPGALFDAALYNVLGIPAVSIPCGFDSAGLPIGLCIAGPRFADGRVLALAHAYEQATPWHTRRPLLTPDMAVPPIPLAQRG
jgi:aspartyl-tRNA(Asn)/glutamyl-tRNA(Gln) amidotransferase subunit A